MLGFAIIIPSSGLLDIREKLTMENKGGEEIFLHPSVFGEPCWVPVVAVGFLRLRQMGLLSYHGLTFSRDVFSVFRSAALGVWASGVTAHVPSGVTCGLLEHSLNSCGAWAWLLCSTWNLLVGILTPG